MRSSFVHLLRGLLIVLVMCGFAAPALALTSTTTTLTLSPASPVGKGQTVVLTATVVGASPTGNVTFMNGATNLGSRSLTSGSATLSVPFNAKGTFSLTAVYAGDSNNATSTSAAKSLTVLNASTTTLSYSGTPPIGTGQGVTLTAAVSATSPTGTVSFYDGATSLGSGTIASGSATLATSFATAGSHSVTAVYNGDASNAGSTSAAQNINVITGTV
ncbi:MAG TPA: Ig-like domain-containing protein, partial [Burkholderiaceae bacterium]